MKKNLFSNLLAVVVVMAFMLVFVGSVYAEDAPAEGAKAAAPKAEAMKKPAMKGMLDGKHFSGEVGSEGKTTGDKETIVFKNGMFHSMACDPMGFTPAPYTATAGEGGVINFSATCTSPKSGTMSWSGTVKGDMIEASVTMTQEGKDPQKMWAKGMMGKMEHKMGKTAAKAKGK